MKKGYWVVAYRSVTDPAGLAAYAELAAPTISSAGGRFLARGGAVKTYEAGLNERTVIVEFESVSLAIECYESESYRKALDALGAAAERDFRIVEGIG